MIVYVSLISESGQKTDKANGRDEVFKGFFSPLFSLIYFCFVLWFTYFVRGQIDAISSPISTKKL